MNRIISSGKKSLFLALGTIRWHINRYLFRRDFPLIATFQLTNRCNFNCRMCNIRNNPRQEALSLLLFKKIIDDLTRMGTVYVTLSGGEPLVVEGIVDYVAYAKSKICFVNLVTNGYLVTQELAGALQAAGLDSLSVSIDAVGAENDSLRGVPGAFEKAVEAIALMRKYAPKVKVTVNTVISRQNLGYIKELADLTERLGVLHKFQPVYRHPDFADRHKDNSQLLIRNADDMERLRSVITYLKAKKHVSNSRYFLSCIQDYFAADYRRDIFNQDCIYPSFACEFREDGSMYPCIVGKKWEGGYAADSGVEKIFRSPEYRKDAGDLKKCRLCRENFSICYLESRLSLPITNFIKFNLLADKNRGF